MPQQEHWFAFRGRELVASAPRKRIVLDELDAMHPGAKGESLRVRAGWYEVTYPGPPARYLLGNETEARREGLIVTP